MGWDRVRGHDDVRHRFETALKAGRLGHAYLFAGPPGVGKALFASELAAALLCESPPTFLTACDGCSACALVRADTHPDFTVTRKPDDKLELPIDTIRELTTTLGLKPARGARKVAVLEDADSFNEESANAFLKTLEEPPAGSLLILIAASADTQLATIRSRCQLVGFRPLLADVIRNILAANGVTDPAVADRAARLANGSAARALAAADESVWAFRTTLLDAITAPRPRGQALAVEWAKFVEDAGDESAAKRERASVTIGLLADILSAALRVALGGGAGDERLRRAAERFGPDGLAELLERCVEADYHVDRRVQLVLVVESLVDWLTRVSAVPPHS